MGDFDGWSDSWLCGQVRRTICKCSQQATVLRDTDNTKSALTSYGMGSQTKPVVENMIYWKTKTIFSTSSQLDSKLVKRSTLPWVSPSMVSARDANVVKLFNSAELLTGQQVASYFSHLASKHKNPRVRHAELSGARWRKLGSWSGVYWVKRRGHS